MEFQGRKDYRNCIKCILSTALHMSIKLKKATYDEVTGLLQQSLKDLTHYTHHAQRKYHEMHIKGTSFSCPYSISHKH